MEQTDRRTDRRTDRSRPIALCPLDHVEWGIIKCRTGPPQSASLSHGYERMSPLVTTGRYKFIPQIAPFLQPHSLTLVLFSTSTIVDVGVHHSIWPLRVASPVSRLQNVGQQRSVLCCIYRVYIYINTVLSRMLRLVVS